MPEINLGLRQYPDKVERVAPWILKWITLLGLRSGPSWPVGPFGLARDAKERVEWAQPEYDISFGQGPTEEEPSASPAVGLCTAAGAGGSSDNRGVCNRHARVGAGCGIRGGGGGRAGVGGRGGGKRQSWGLEWRSRQGE